MHEAFIKLEHGWNAVMRYEIEITIWARYVPHLIPTVEKKSIEIDLAALASRYEISSRYYVSRIRGGDEPSRDRQRLIRKVIIVIRGDLDSFYLSTVKGSVFIMVDDIWISATY
ncbi:hypothetical protein IEQ34_002804 [Dendrobium chrysotoxum]|uniref:Uncharacterized protein n=1 Tax=Dendrobium chrysotoxum TaxID=161865 RepID=A0AAV7HFE5_DENCH|nr:hypothetical protein IEQ34_002804 [Dendrobium chrysotoxum]